MSQNWARFVVYRFAPVTVVAALAGAILDRQGAATLWPLLAIGVLHGTLTSGRGLLSELRGRRTVLSATRMTAYAAVFSGCVAATGAAVPLVPFTTDYVPDPDELIPAVWAAGLAAVGGAWLLSLSRQHEDDSEARIRAFQRSKDNLGDDLWRRAAEVAEEVDADERLVRAVLLVENIQRPRWLRRLETPVARLLRTGSVGPLQVDGLPPSGDDARRVEASIRSRFAGQRYPEALNGSAFHWRRAFLKHYNGDSQWMLDVEEAYSWVTYIQSAALAHSQRAADDGLPVIEVHGFERSNDTILLDGTVATYGTDIVLLQTRGASAELASDVVKAAEGPERIRWTRSLPLAPGATHLILRELRPPRQLHLIVEKPVRGWFSRKLGRLLESGGGDVVADYSAFPDEGETHELGETIVLPIPPG